MLRITGDQRNPRRQRPEQAFHRCVVQFVLANPARMLPDQVIDFFELGCSLAVLR